MTVGLLSKSCWAGGGGDNGERGKPKGSNRRGKLWLSPWGQSYPPATYTGTRGGIGRRWPEKGGNHHLEKRHQPQKGETLGVLLDGGQACIRASIVNISSNWHYISVLQTHWIKRRKKHTGCFVMLTN